MIEKKEAIGLQELFEENSKVGEPSLFSFTQKSYLNSVKIETVIDLESKKSQSRIESQNRIDSLWHGVGLRK